MHDYWGSFNPIWQACIELAWEAYCAGSLPIGAVVADADGVILSRGRNRIHEPRKLDGNVSETNLAHAELNALIALPFKHSDRHTWVLYTTTEPCPMCLGALYMSGLRELHYAARDPWAGSVNLLGRSPYLSRKQIQVHGPFNADLEVILESLTAVVFLNKPHPTLLLVLESMREVLPKAVSFGEALYEDSVLEKLCADQTPAPEVFNWLAHRWHKSYGAL